MVIVVNDNQWNDYELIYLYRCGETKALEYLIEKHIGSIISIQNDLLNVCYKLDRNDIFQELLCVFTKSIESYQESKGTFFTYAFICVKRAAAKKLKEYFSVSQKINYQSVSIDNNFEIYDSISFQEVLKNKCYSTDPVYAYHVSELEEQYHVSQRILSLKEKKVFELYEQGYSPNDIALILNWPIKEVRNSLDRAKTKIKKDIIKMGYE